MGTPAQPLSNVPPDLSANLGDTPPKAKRVVSAHAIHGGLTEGRKATMYDLGDAIPLVPLVWFKENVLAPLPSALGDLSGVLDELKRRKRFCPPGNPDKKAADKSRRHQASENKEPLVWKSFHTKPSAGHGVDFNEDKMFKAIESLASEVAEAAHAILPAEEARQLVEFRCNPSMTLMSTLRDTSSRPDSYGVYTDHSSYNQSSTKVYWELIVAPGEFKKRNEVETRNDNATKIMWSMNHIMREDVRRRFVVGYTIEDTNMRLWFCSRADVFVSESFNFMTAHRDLAHFFLSFMYASESQLGYDMTIHYPTDVSLYGKQWDIDVRVWVPEREATAGAGKGKGSAGKGKGKGKDQDQGVDSRSGEGSSDGEGKGQWETRKYQTRKMLSNIGAEAIRGRGTRVWEVSRLSFVNNCLVPQDKTVVLKDSWIDDNRDREADIMRQIVDSAPDDVKPLLVEHMLTVVCNGDVPSGPADTTKDTTLRMRNGQAVPTKRYFKLEERKTVKINTSKLPAGSGTSSKPDPDRSPRIVKFDDKCHHRTVFEEVAKPIDTLNAVFDIFDVLTQVANVLGIIHKCGWIHRDISAGNVLFVYDADGERVAKIADFEYAKKMSDKSSHTLRTARGTFQYMAVEAEYHAYLFNPAGGKKAVFADKKTSSNATARVAAARAIARKGEALTRTATQPSSTTPQIKQPTYPFYHNPLHDIESIWWLAVRLTLYRLIAMHFLLQGDQYWVVPAEAVVRAKQQRDFFALFFKDRDTRLKTLLSGDKFISGGTVAYPGLLKLMEDLEIMRNALATAYIAAERDVFSISHDTGVDVSEALYLTFVDLMEYYAGPNAVLFDPIDCPEKKRTPEEPAALPPATSLDGHLPGKKRLRKAHGPTLDPIPSADDEYVDIIECIRGLKRMKLDSSEPRAPVTSPSTIPGPAPVEVTPFDGEASGNVGSGKSKGKGKGNAKEEAPRRSRSRVPPSEPARRSARLRSGETSER